MTITGLSGTKYQLESKCLSDGGEGEIYRVIGGGKKKVAKIYKAGIPSKELEEKLIIMVSRPPSSKVISQVAWPLDVVCDSNKIFCGFIMPELNINFELGDIYKYPSQLSISSLQKIIIAENICAVISEVHRAGYVFGDFNPRNIGVDINSGTVVFLDTDSYHVFDPSQNRTFRCNVCAPGYSAPELLEKCAAHISTHPHDNKQAYAKTSLPTFTKETDNFALAVHIFKLLMNGYTPYGGIKNVDSPSQASPGTGDAAVRRDNYCFKPGMKPQSSAILPMDAFPQELAGLFTRAFIAGKVDPKQRPTALEWHFALARCEKTLVTCVKNPLHQYDRKNSLCPLCESDQRYSISVSPLLTQKQYKGTVQPPIQVVQHQIAQPSAIVSSTNSTLPTQAASQVPILSPSSSNTIRQPIASYLSKKLLIGTGASVALFCTVGYFGAFMIGFLLYAIFFAIVCYRSYWGKGSDSFQTGRLAVSAITGFIGAFWFGSYIKFGQSDLSKWIALYIVTLLIPHIIHAIATRWF